MLANLRGVVIDDAVAYWLDDMRGNPLGPASDRTVALLAHGLTMFGERYPRATWIVATWAG